MHLAIGEMPTQHQPHTKTQALELTRTQVHLVLFGQFSELGSRIKVQITWFYYDVIVLV